MKAKSAHQKGKLLESYVADRISHLDPQAVRQIGSGSGHRKGDIHNSLGLCIECKNTKVFNLKATLAQVRREAMGYQEEVIIWHPPQKPLADSIVVLGLDFFITLLEARQNGMAKEDILDKYEVKNNLQKAIHHLKQVDKNL